MKLLNKLEDYLSTYVSITRGKLLAFLMILSFLDLFARIVYNWNIGFDLRFFVLCLVIAIFFLFGDFK